MFAMHSVLENLREIYNLIAKLVLKYELICDPRVKVKKYVSLSDLFSSFHIFISAGEANIRSEPNCCVEGCKRTQQIA